MDDALGFAVQEQKDHVLSLLLCRIRQDLRDGLSMSSALRHYQAFPQIVAKMIEVAESTGTTDRGAGDAVGILPVSTKNDSGAKTAAQLSSGCIQHFHSPVSGDSYFHGADV